MKPGKSSKEAAYDPLSWLLMLAVILLGLGLIFFPSLTGRADSPHSGHGSNGMLTPHEHFHDDFYVKWLDDIGHSCCNSKTRSANGDCAPLSADNLRSTDAGYEVRIDGTWVKVPATKVRPYFAPDFSSHLCNQGQRVLCLVVGGGI